MKKPTEHQFETAADWLRYNEGDGGEAEACKAVADWIDDMLYKDMLRKTAKANGVTVKDLKAKLKSMGYEA